MAMKPSQKDINKTPQAVLDYMNNMEKLLRDTDEVHYHSLRARDEFIHMLMLENESFRNALREFNNKEVR